MSQSVTNRFQPASLRAVRLNLKSILLAILAFALAGLPAGASSVKKVNLVDLIRYSDTILAGRVESVQDGFDSRGIPYTEITLKVGRRIRGKVEEQAYTFRQFGLKQPRKSPSGKINVSLTPDGWARYGVGEDVALFLGPAASKTGLRTTVGLKQGKIAVVNGKVKHSEFTGGLFQNVMFDSGLLAESHQELVSKSRANQDIDIDQFLSLVRQAVDEDWVGKGRMKNAK